jgi:hypothetical protein
MVDLEKLTFLGPGSEWFWSMLQFVVVAVSLVGLYRQVRLQTAKDEIQQAEALASEWNSERMHRSRLDVLEYVEKHERWADIPVQPAGVVGDFWERLGYLVRKGHIDRDLVNEYLGTSIRLWWALLGPLARGSRETLDDPAIYEHFDWLAGAMEEADRKAGRHGTFDQRTFAHLLERSTQVSRAAVRAEERLRAVPRPPRSKQTDREE